MLALKDDSDEELDCIDHGNFLKNMIGFYKNKLSSLKKVFTLKQ